MLYPLSYGGMLNGLIASMNKATSGQHRCHGSHPQPQKRHQHYPQFRPPCKSESHGCAGPPIRGEGMLLALAVVVIRGKGDSHAFGRYTHNAARDGDFAGLKLVRDGQGNFPPEGWRPGSRCLDEDAPPDRCFRRCPLEKL